MFVGVEKQFEAGKTHSCFDGHNGTGAVPEIA
jgi:hypothetical protein